MTESEYRKLPGRGRKFSIFAGARTRSRLYLARDHLLSVESNGWVEKYRRFYFADIQALVVCETKTALALNIIFAVFAAAAAALALTRAGGISAPAGIAWSITAGIFAVFLAINFLLGSTCRATIQTAIGREPLISLNRLRAAQKTLALLKPAVENAQGALAPDELPERLAEFARRAPARIIPGRALAGTHYLRHAGYRGGLHRWAFALALLAGACALADAFLFNSWLTLATMVSVAALTVLVIMAIVRQHESNTGFGLRGVTWALAGFAGIYFFACYIAIIALTFANPRDAGREWKLFQKAASTPGSIHLIFDAATATAALGLGIAGLFLADALRREPNTTLPENSAT